MERDVWKETVKFSLRYREMEIFFGILTKILF